MKRPFISSYTRMSNVEWKILSMSVEYKILESLTCGQAFRWRIFEDTFLGVFHNRVWQIKSSGSSLFYKVLACPHWRDCASKVQKIDNWTQRRGCGCEQDEKKLIGNYFRTSLDVKRLQKIWISGDPKIEEAVKSAGLISLLDQEPFENLITFVCTQNNNVSRIVKMIEMICCEFGEELFQFTSNGHDVTFHDFPTLKRLCEDDVTEKLRKLGFGYRAPYIYKCAKMIDDNGGTDWLESLRQKDYEIAFNELQKLPGIGRKVADCICLMSLNKLEAVPIDTHIRKLAVTKYGFTVKNKTLTKKTYKEIGDFFRSVWGSSAGWAQTIEFSLALKPNLSLYQLK